MPAVSKMARPTMGANSSVPIGKSHAQLLRHNLGSRTESADLHLPKAINLEVTPTIPVRGRLVKRQRAGDSAALAEINYYSSLEAEEFLASLASRSRSVYSSWAKVSEKHFTMEYPADDYENQVVD